MSKALEVQTVGDLLDVLAHRERSQPLFGTWEGTSNAIYVYDSADGDLVLDLDGCSYQTRLQQTKCHACDNIAASLVGTDELPCCYSHFPKH